VSHRYTAEASTWLKVHQSSCIFNISSAKTVIAEIKLVCDVGHYISLISLIMVLALLMTDMH